MAEFRMPSLGADMEAGTLVEWRKRPGERVKRGDIIAEVETEKGIIEVEVFSSGVVDKLIVEPGTKVPVGTPLALIREDGERMGTATAAPTPPSPAPRVDATAPPVAPPSPLPSPLPERARASPAARRRALALGVDASTLAGTGPGGAVTIADVERAATARATPAPAATGAAAHAPEPRLPSDDERLRMRQAIASAMARSKREIPHYYVSHTVDLTPALRFMESENERAAVEDRLIPAILFLKATALALREYPDFNGYFVDGHFVKGPGIHVGAAIALRGGGLVAPALKDTDRATLCELMHRFRDLVTRARAGSLRSSEISDATITVTSLGDRGTEAVTAVIYPPQTAIVGFGRIVSRPWVVDGAVVPRSVVHVSLSADHRTTDGHAGALFLSTLSDLLMEPERL
jgi:pyruvate dehydrogenase E2 component (dihydrolipoamide acetyltransferase)